MASKRDPVTHRTAAQAKKHRDTYRQTPEYKEKAKAWAHNWRESVKSGQSKKGDGKDIAHKKDMSSGGAKRSKSNLTLQPASKNRGHGKSPGGTKAGTKRR